MHKISWGREGGGAEKGIPRRSGPGPRSDEVGSREQAEGPSRFSSPGKIGVLSEPPARKPRPASVGKELLGVPKARIAEWGPHRFDGGEPTGLVPQRAGG
jgi:hypothetical protein